MTLERLREILAAYGADQEHWPAAERDAALALLTASPEAREAARDAMALDDLLARYDNPAAGAFDPRRVVAATQSAAPANDNRVEIRWHNLAGLAAAAVVGFVVGWSGVDQSIWPTGIDQTIEQAELLGGEVESWTW